MKRTLTIFAGLCCPLLLSGAAGVSAQPERGGNWETTIQLIASDSEKFNGENRSSVEIDSAIGLGFGAHYNFDRSWALGFDATWIEPDYEAVLNSESEGLIKISHEMSVFSGQLRGTWNLMEGPFTPYLQAGIGWTYIDSNVADGPPITGCWWDPFWGYVCQNFYDTYDDTSFSYSFGAGLRFEFGNGMFVRGSLNRLEIDNGDFDPGVNSARFELGWMIY